ncbi:hypothetical protein ACET3Z_000841 [Daucus carota]
MELQRQASNLVNSQTGSSSTSQVSTTFASQALENLKLHKFQSLHFQGEIEHLNSTILAVKKDLTNKIDAKLPSKAISVMSDSEKRHAKLESKLDTLEDMINVLDARMHEMLQHQRIQTDLLQHLLMASGVSVPRPPALDENKKGEKAPLPSPAELVARIPPPYFTANELKARSKRDSIRKRLDQLLAKQSSKSTSTTTTVPTSFPTTTTILRVITPEIVIPSKKEKARPDKNEYKLLGQEIKSYKDSTDEALKAHFAIIYREGQKLFVGTGHPYYSFAKAEEVARECERKEFKSQLSINQEIEVNERYATELEEELEAKLLQNENRIDPENPPKKKRVKSRSKMPEAAERREEEPEKHVQSSKPSSPIKETTVMHLDVNFHDESILPKEEPIDLDNIPIPAFLVQEIPKPKKKVKTVAKKMANPPKPPKEPENPDNYLVIANIEEISELELDLNDLQEVRGIESTSKLPERLIFSYKSKGDVTWPLHRVLSSEGFSSLTKIYAAMKRT